MIYVLLKKKCKSEAHHTNSGNGEGIGNVELYSGKLGKKKSC